jgi:hypothetical protein
MGADRSSCDITLGTASNDDGVWTRIPDASIWRRPTFNSERYWIAKPQVDREIYLIGDVKIIDPRRIAEIQKSAQVAWMRLAFDYPEVTLKGKVDSNGGWLEYFVPEDAIESARWVRKTLFVGVTGSLVPTFEEKIARANKDWKSNDGRLQEAAYLHLCVVHGQDKEDTIDNLGFVLRFDHLCTDGIGARILAGKFFTLLALYLDPVMHNRGMEWRVDAKSNLSPIWPGLMNKKQVMTGETYENAVKRMRENRRFHGYDNIGLPIASHTSLRSNRPHSEFFFYSLTKNQSATLLSDIKSKIDLSTNITHLTHAAMVLAILRAHPQSPDVLLANSEFPSPCYMNGRRYLSSHISEYLPICQLVEWIQFTPIHYILPPQAPLKDVRRVLLRACRDSSLSYKRIKSNESILSEYLGCEQDLDKHITNNTGEPTKLTPSANAGEEQPVMGSNEKNHKGEPPKYANPVSNISLHSIKYEPAHILRLYKPSSLLM